jgi:hypothetical protein
MKSSVYDDIRPYGTILSKKFTESKMAANDALPRSSKGVHDGSELKSEKGMNRC